MRKLLIVALLAAFAPLGIAHAATPKPTPTKMAMKMTGKMTGMKMAGKKTTKKKPAKKKMVKKTTTKKTMPMRDPKTGRFMKKPTPTPTKK